MKWIMSHLNTLWVPGSIFAGFALSEAKKYLSNIETMETAWIATECSKLQRPEDKAAAKALLTAIKSRFPDGGEAVNALFVDKLISDYPQVKPFREDAIAVLKGLEVAATAGADKGLK